MSQPLTRRQKKKAKDKERKERRRQTKRELAGDNQARGDEETQLADPAAETIRTTEEDAGAHFRAAGASVAVSNKKMEEVASDEAQGRAQTSGETAAVGAEAKQVSQAAVSVATPVSQVVVAGAAAVVEVEVPGVAQMEVTMAVAVAAPSRSATTTTVAANNGSEEAFARELKSKETKRTEIINASTTTEATKKTAQEPAAPATAPATTSKPEERARLEQDLMKAVIADLRNRAEEAAFAKHDHDDDSHSSGSTYMGGSSASSQDDNDSEGLGEEGWQTLSTPPAVTVQRNLPVHPAEPARYKNIGGTYYPVAASPAQQQGHASWGLQGGGAGAYRVPRQYEHPPAMVFEENVEGGCHTPMPPAMHQQTSGGTCLQNFGGTWYPVAAPPAQMHQREFAYEYEEPVVGMCYSPHMKPGAFEYSYGDNVAAGMCDRQTEYVQHVQHVPPQSSSFGQKYEGMMCPMPEASMPHHESHRTMTYEGKTYPYWMPL